MHSPVDSAYVNAIDSVVSLARVQFEAIGNRNIQSYSSLSFPSALH